VPNKLSKATPKTEANILSETHVPDCKRSHLRRRWHEVAHLV